MLVQNGHITLPANPAGGDIARYRRVTLTAGVVALAGITVRDFGMLEHRYVSSGLGKTETASVLAANASGTRMCIAASAIAQYAVVDTAADGKVNDGAVATSIPYGIALTAATADGDEIEVLTFGGERAANA